MKLRKKNFSVVYVDIALVFVFRVRVIKIVLTPFAFLLNQFIQAQIEYLTLAKINLCQGTAKPVTVDLSREVTGPYVIM